jgi:hypothetical protein
MSTSYSRTLLLSQEGVFLGTNYGFPENTAAEVRAEFPDIVVIWRAPMRRMEVWACGEQGALLCLDNDLQPWQNPLLVQQIRENRRALEDYRPGDKAREIRARLDKERKAKVDRQVDAMDPEREAISILNNFGGRVAPVAVPASLPAM